MHRMPRASLNTVATGRRFNLYDSRCRIPAPRRLLRCYRPEKGMEGLSNVIASTVVRSVHQGESHRGVYLIDLSCQVDSKRIPRSLPSRRT